MKNLNEVGGFLKDVMLLSDVKRSHMIVKLEKMVKNLVLVNGDHVDGFVFKTDNIDQFKNIEGNRSINKESGYIKSLAESIAEIGIVSPIIINENNETIDGQRRITAVKKYQLPSQMRYIRMNGANIKTVGDMNRLQIPWTYKDWLHKYVAIGNPEYIKYNELETKYSNLMKSRSLRSLFMNNKIESFNSFIWESGNFKINYEKLEKVLSFLTFLGKVNTIGDKDNIFAKNRNFQKALYEMFSTDPFSEVKLFNKLKLNFNRINIRTEYSEYKKILDGIYTVKHRETEKNVLEPAMA